MVTKVTKPVQERENKVYEEKKDRMVQYYCWNDTCRRGWKARYPDPENPQYLCPHCGSHVTTFKPL